LKEIIPLIRFPLMTLQEVAASVVPASILEMKEQLDLFSYLSSKEAKKKSGGGQIELPKTLSRFSDTPRKASVMLKWDETLSRPITISEEGAVATHSSSDGAAFCTTAFTEGKHRWTVTILNCQGNCLDVGVSCRHSQTDSPLRVSGIHAGGTSIQIQSGCGVSRGSGPSWTRFTNGIVIHVLLDMDARTLSYNVNGADSGVIVNSLPATVYPACDFRQSGLSVRIHDYRAGWD